MVWTMWVFSPIHWMMPDAVERFRYAGSLRSSMEPPGVRDGVRGVVLPRRPLAKAVLLIRTSEVVQRPATACSTA